MNIKAVLFDLDGVITDTAEYHYIAWKQLAEQLGIEIDKAFNEQLKGVSRMESLERILRHGNRQNDLSTEEKVAFATQKNEHYVQLLDNVTPQDVYPGIRELLLELKAANVRAVIASASKNAPQILKSLEITEFFDYVVNPDEIEYGKPAPDIFLRGAEVVGIAPKYCIGIEDAQAGIEAIKSANMFAIGIGEERVLRPSGADIVLPSTETLSWSLLQTLG
jgi:beta-phosphoglucomutase